jgi:hypothetical protein
MSTHKEATSTKAIFRIELVTRSSPNKILSISSSYKDQATNLLRKCNKQLSVWAQAASQAPGQVSSTLCRVPKSSQTSSFHQEMHRVCSIGTVWISNKLHNKHNSFRISSCKFKREHPCNKCQTTSSNNLSLVSFSKLNSKLLPHNFSFKAWINNILHKISLLKLNSYSLHLFNKLSYHSMHLMKCIWNQITHKTYCKQLNLSPLQLLVSNKWRSSSKSWYLTLTTSTWASSSNNTNRKLR